MRSFFARTTATAFAFVALSIADSPPARADVARPGPAHELRLELDLPLILLGGAAAMSFVALPEVRRPTCPDGCEASRIHPIDRPAAGLSDSRWAHVGDVATVSTLVAPLLIVVLGAGLAGASLVGVARVGAGAHFPTDVAIGAGVGVGAGIALPALHRSGTTVVPVTDGDSMGLAVVGPLF